MQLTENGLAGPASARPEPAPVTRGAGIVRRSVRRGKRHKYHLTSTSALAGVIWIGGGLLGLLLAIVTVVIMVRR